MSNIVNGNAAIVGIGATEFSKNSGRSEMQLAVESVSAALSDAGLRGSDIDGVCSLGMDNNWDFEVFRQVGGRHLKFFATSPHGGGQAIAPLFHAAMAVSSGACEAVVIYRAMNERSGFRFGSGKLLSEDPNNPAVIHFSWTNPFGLMTPASWVAMNARRYMADYGATSEDFGRVAVAMRDFAATNPKAFFHNAPITLADHQASRLIADPLRLLDCCQESDGAVALVITRTERARDLKHTPAIIAAISQSAVQSTAMMTPYYSGSISEAPELAAIAPALFEAAGIKPADIDVGCLYDHFSPAVLFQLEALGFCPRGEARHFIREQGIGRAGRLPVNPHGGQLGEGYIHGFNGLAEAVRQVRGTSVNQVEGAEWTIVTGAAPGVPTSAAILRKG
jgi:acetyl-CoA acetyltransferase